MQGAALLAGGAIIGVADLSLPGSNGMASAGAGAVDTATGDCEPDRTAIEAALASSRGVVAQAAAALGMSRQALYRRLERLGISRV